MQNPLLSPKFPLLSSFYFRDSLADGKIAGDATI